MNTKNKTIIALLIASCSGSIMAGEYQDDMTDYRVATIDYAAKQASSRIILDTLEYHIHNATELNKLFNGSCSMAKPEHYMLYDINNYLCISHEVSYHAELITYHILGFKATTLYKVSSNIQDFKEPIKPVSNSPYSISTSYTIKDVFKTFEYYNEGRKGYREHYVCFDDTTSYRGDIEQTYLTCKDGNTYDREYTFSFVNDTMTWMK